MMEAQKVISIIKLLKTKYIKVWLDGGWAVDALLGKQTRIHKDVDIVVQQKDLPKLRNLLGTQGYKDVKREGTTAWNFVLGDNKGNLIDVHAVVFDKKGNGLYGPVEKGIMYPADSLTGIGVVDGYKVECISAEYMIKFHSGYNLDDNDYKDVLALCKKFRLDYPKEFTHLKNKNLK